MGDVWVSAPQGPVDPPRTCLLVGAPIPRGYPWVRIGIRDRVRARFRARVRARVRDGKGKGRWRI